MSDNNSNPVNLTLLLHPMQAKKEMKYSMRLLTRLGYKVDDIEGYPRHTYPKMKVLNLPNKNEGRLGKIKLSKLRPYKRSVNLKNCPNDIPVAEDDYAPL